MISSGAPEDRRTSEQKDESTKDWHSANLLWEDKEATLDVTVVVPYYNPGNLLRSSIAELLEVLEGARVTYEVIAVSDGSTDGSEGSIEDLPSDKIRRVSLHSNIGKGEALRVGLSMGRGRYLGFIDADGDVSPDQIGQLVALMTLYEPDIVLGSKRHPMSQVEYPLARRIYSWGFQQLIRMLFHLSVKDTQTGIKLVKREVLSDVLPHMVEKRFAFDLELFVVARHLGYERFFEAPVKLGRRFTSTVSLKSVWTILVDTLSIFWRLRAQHYYDTDGQRFDAVVRGASQVQIGDSDRPDSKDGAIKS